MPLYEIVLRKPSGADEVRFTDHALRLDQPLLIDSTRWTITSVEPADHPLAAHRYVCVCSSGDRQDGEPE
jgi:hypothetical protein